MLLKHAFKLWLLGLCLALVSWASPTPKSAPKPPQSQKAVFEPYTDIEAVLPSMYLYTDGKGHYLALSITLDLDSRTLNGHYPRLLFWGDKNALFAQRIPTGDGSFKEHGKMDTTPGLHPDASLSYYVNVWDPSRENSWIARPNEGDLHVVCDEQKTTLTPVPAEEAKAILEKAKFYRPRFMRMPHFLARDNKGTYYYIDRSAKKEEKDFRIFIGKRGQLKHTKLKNIIQDSAGEVYSTPTGSLRIVIDKNEVLWIRQKQQETLVKLDEFGVMNGVPYQTSNLSLVFGELGVYAGQKVGTPCDDL